MPATQQRRPNVVIVVSDDHAAHAVGAYGSVVNRTPRIDQLASEGALLENCFATNALCAPSRASILTGTYSHVNGVSTLATAFDAGQPTFVSMLRDAGYRTAIVGKWHLGEGEGHDPQGFDYWDVLLDQGEYFQPRFLSADGLRTEEGYATDVITDLALRWLEGLDGDAPWCLLIWHKAPHRPWEPDERHRGMYTDIPVPSTFDDDMATRSASARRASMRIAEFLAEEDLKEPVPDGLGYEAAALWKYQRYLEDYLACVASVDDNVGRVIDWLKQRDAFDDTLVVYTSDQGFFLGDHGWFDKRFMYEQALRMPFVVSMPSRVPAGSVLSGLTTNVDIAQTVLECAGVAPDARMQGRSFWPDLIGVAAAPAADGIYYRYWEHEDRTHRGPAHYGYRTDRYKLIYFYNDGLGIAGTGRYTYPPEWELYDLHEDPDETNNVAHDPAYADIRLELEQRLWTRQHELGDEPHPSQPDPFSRLAATTDAPSPEGDVALR